MRIFGFDCFAPKLSQDVNPLSKVSSWKPLSSVEGSPSHRFQHSVCRSGQYLYVFGGRGKKGTQQDLWKYDINLHEWLEVATSGCKPPGLEGHTVVEYHGKHFYFGGEMSFASAGEIPLWIYDPKTSKWTKKSKSTSDCPRARREHVAVVYDNKMYIHGGYIDLKGPSNEMWAYRFESDTWQSVEYAEPEHSPNARYKHAACVYENYMWMCGGLSGISDRNELQVWTCDFYSYAWCHVKTKCAPWQLYNHALCVVSDTVYVFGGSREDGHTCSKLWKVELNEDPWTASAQTWQSCQFLDKVRPSPSANHCIIALPDVKHKPCNEKKVFSNMKSFMPMISTVQNDGPDTAIVPFAPPPYSPEVSSGPGSKDLYIEPKFAPSNEPIITSPENGELEMAQHNVTDIELTEANDLHIDENHFRQHSDQDSLLDKEKMTRKNSKFGIHNISFTKQTSSKPDSCNDGDVVFQTCDKDMFLGGLKVQRKSSVFENHFTSDQHKISLVGPEKMRRFSYNLSGNDKTWQPTKTANEKFRSTSFIQVVPSVGKSVSRLSTDIDLQNNSQQATGDNMEQVVIKNESILESGYQNLDEKQPKKTEDIKMQSNLHLTRLLVIGGKLADASLNVDRPISMWQCQLCGTI